MKSFPNARDAGVLYVDLHLVHEVTSPQAFRAIARRQLGCVAKIERSRRSITRVPRTPMKSSPHSDQSRILRRARCASSERIAVSRVELFGLGSDRLASCM